MSRFRSGRICHRLPRIATAGLHLTLVGCVNSVATILQGILLGGRLLSQLRRKGPPFAKASVGAPRLVGPPGCEPALPACGSANRSLFVLAWGAATGNAHLHPKLELQALPRQSAHDSLPTRP